MTDNPYNHLHNRFLNRAEDEYAKTKAFAESLMYLYDEMWIELNWYIHDSYLTILEEYAKVQPIQGAGSSTLNQLGIYQTLQKQIVSESLKLLERQNDLVIPFMEDAIEQGYLKRSYDYLDAVDDLSSFYFYNASLLEDIMNRKWFGGNYYTRSVANNELLASTIDDILAKGVIEGFPLEHMMLQLREKFDWIGKGRAKTLIQSEVGFVQEQSNFKALEDAGFEQYIYLATLEVNTCPICRGLDMTVHYLRDAKVGKNYPLMHGNCRCTAIGYFAELPLMERWHRNPETGKGELISSMTYDEWFKHYVVRSA